MLARKLFLFIFFISCFGSYAQSFQLDTTFKPFFDIRNQGYPSITDIYENPSDGRIYVGGFFQNSYRNRFFGGIVCYNRDGSLFPRFSFGSGSGMGGGYQIGKYNDNNYYVSELGSVLLFDSLGKKNNPTWRLAFLKSVKCRTGLPYFFKDGSSLFANGSDNWGVPCPIINPPDTFPGRHIIKLNPQGLWDSTFVPDANSAPEGFVPYDSNRLFIFGKPFEFTHYNGHRVNGLCRIYLDGTLDTTFTSPFSAAIAHNFFSPNLVEKDGGFFISGQFVLRDYPNQLLTLVRCNADGSLDSTFMNTSGPTDSTNSTSFATGRVVPTEDGGYIVSGEYNIYQGYAKNCIAKIDSNGKVEPQYFTSRGPDSASIVGTAILPTIDVVLKSKYGGYYIGGNFLKWDNKPTQPLIRIYGLQLNVGMGEKKINKTSVVVYPNPTNDKITIQSSASIKNVELLDLLGKRIQFHTLKTSTPSHILDLSHLPQGIYLLSIQLENGERLSRKVVKN